MDYFATNSLAAFSVISGTPGEQTGRSDTTYTTNALITSSVIYKSPQFINPNTGAAVSLTDAWVHFSYSMNGTGNQTLMEILNSAGTPVVRIFQPNVNALRPDYWNGSAWVTTAGTWPVSVGFFNNDIDIHVVCGVSGSIDLYINNTLGVSITGLNAAVNNLAFIRPQGSVANNFQSQFLVSDVNTVGAKVKDLVINANATYTAWSGSFTDIVKTGLNDATMISSSVLGDKKSFDAANITIASGMAVSSMWFSARGRLNASSPGHFKALVRIGGSDYSPSYDFGGLATVAFGPSIASFAVDPSTSAAWGVTNINAAELGFVTTA